PVTFNGGDGTDSLAVTGSTFTTLAYNPTGAGLGNLAFNGANGAATVSFTDLEAAAVTSAVGTTTVNVDPNNAFGGPVTTTFSSAGTGQDSVAFDSGAVGLAFANPSVALVVNGDNGDDDTITFASLDSGFKAALTV